MVWVFLFLVEFSLGFSRFQPKLICNSGFYFSSGSPKWARLGITSTTLGIEVEVKDALCHPDYNPGNDIALVKLKEAVNSSHVPACLDTEGVRAGEIGVGVGRPIGQAYKECKYSYPVQFVVLDYSLAIKESCGSVTDNHKLRVLLCNISFVYTSGI